MDTNIAYDSVAISKALVLSRAGQLYVEWQETPESMKELFSVDAGPEESLTVVTAMPVDETEDDW